MDTEKQMQAEINRQREIHNQAPARNLKTGRPKYQGGYRPGDREYLPPVTGFVTIRFRNGVIVMPADDFKRLPKTKQKKLMQW